MDKQTKYEINRKVAELLGMEIGIGNDQNGEYQVIWIKDGLGQGVFNPCDNGADNFLVIDWLLKNGYSRELAKLFTTVPLPILKQYICLEAIKVRGGDCE